jgi:indolepyruvate ferredoxin oxidoreductase
MDRLNKDAVSMTRNEFHDPNDAGIGLQDKWTVQHGRVLISGTQAIARVLLVQSEIDKRRGLNTAGYITGYRGSPLGGVDSSLWSIGDRLEKAGILFHPGVNEDIAATAVRGTQQIDAVGDAKYDGVFAAWYGKGPGVDRSGDAFKHGNFAGTHRNGGVVAFFGDDHAGKSSTVSHQSEQAMAASLIPSLYPADASEVLQYGLMAFALSRYSGSWVGVKCVNEVVEQTATVDLDLDAFETVSPPPLPPPPEGLHIRNGVLAPLRDEVVVTDFRLPMVKRFVRANGIDRVIARGATPRLGIVTAGKSYGDVLGAFAILGLTLEDVERSGISLYKVGCIWPLEPEGFAEFSAGHSALLIVEEKKSFLEAQAAALLINHPDRPMVLGKVDQNEGMLLDATLPHDPDKVAHAILTTLDQLGIADTSVEAARIRLRQRVTSSGSANEPLIKRTPYFCSGCPHNRSTQIPDGSMSMTGIGCHGMANFVRPDKALTATQMGGEGGNWIGLAPFTHTGHIFQNMGDGTYYHSGLMAIRAAVASGVNITYKILYNDAVAMTGGQPVDGPISVSEIAHQVRHEGVRRIVIVSDNPDNHRRDRSLPTRVDIYHRDDLDEVQRELRDETGCTILIYEQTCAAEKRRRRKRGRYPDPAKRVYIAQEVCESCGDCSVQSTCVSIIPQPTPFGEKRAIDQTSCNKDFSCANGFCPSFITVEGASLRKPEKVGLDGQLFADLSDTRIASIDSCAYNVIMAGIGGTGVITVAAILGMAAHLDGLAVSLLDMAGLAQKNGAVYSHVRIAASPSDIPNAKIGAREADVMLGFDLVAALGDDTSAMLAAGRSVAFVNADVSATAAFQFDRDAVVRPELLLAQLKRLAGEESVVSIPASQLADVLLGGTVASNMLLLGVVAQSGLLPVSVTAITRAIRLNGAAVEANLQAFALGRLMVADPSRVEPLVTRQSTAPLDVPTTLDEIIEHRVAHLRHYQDEAYAERFRGLVAKVRLVEKDIVPSSERLALAVARGYAKVLAYKDEYEVARLLTSHTLTAELRRTFADGGRISFNLAPPILSGRMSNGRPRKRSLDARIAMPVLRIVAGLKWVRGTRLDLFALTTERRMERRLIADYERLVAFALEHVTAFNHDLAVRLLSQIDEVRGFGPVKHDSVIRYDATIRDQQAALLQSRPSVMKRQSAG